MSTVKYNVFIYEADYSIKLIGEYLDRTEAMELYWSGKLHNELTGEPFIGICEVTKDYLNQIRKQKLEKLEKFNNER